jgi:hypothetical protein
VISTGVCAIGSAWALSKSARTRNVKFIAGGVSPGKSKPGACGRIVGR